MDLLYVVVEFVDDEGIEEEVLFRFRSFRNSVSNQCNDMNNPVDNIDNIIICIRATSAMAAAVVNNSKQPITNRTNGSSNKPPPGSIICEINDDMLNELRVINHC